MANVDQGHLPPKAVIIKFRPYSHKELTVLYGISAKTFNRWLQPFAETIGKRNGRYYTIRQVRMIFEFLDFPSVEQDEENNK
jgi:hypothetical protein